MLPSHVRGQGARQRRLGPELHARRARHARRRRHRRGPVRRRDLGPRRLDAASRSPCSRATGLDADAMRDVLRGRARAPTATPRSCRARTSPSAGRGTAARRPRSDGAGQTIVTWPADRPDTVFVLPGRGPRRRRRVTRALALRAAARRNLNARVAAMSDRSDAWEARPARAGGSSGSTPSLERLPERRERFATLGDLPIDGLYGPWDWDAPTPDGESPGPRRPDRRRPPRRAAARRRRPLRRLRPAARRRPARASRRSRAASTRRATASRLWTMRMFAGFGAAEDTNARFRQLLAAGQTGLSIAYDMPTLYGYDTDDPEAEGEFGTCGVAVSCLADMEVLLDGPAARSRQHLDDDQLAGRADLGDVHRRGREGGRPAGARSRARPRTTSSRSSSPRRSSCSRPSRRCASSSTRSSSGRARCRAGTRSRSAATTSARPARPPSRSWRSRSPTAWPTSRRAWPAACASTTSRRGSRSSSTPTATSSRRSPSSGRRAGSGGSS